MRKMSNDSYADMFGAPSKVFIFHYAYWLDILESYKELHCASSVESNNHKSQLAAGHAEYGLQKKPLALVKTVCLSGSD